MNKLFIANHKNKMTLQQANQWVETYKHFNFENVIIAPSFIHLYLYRNLNTKLCAQDVSDILNKTKTGDVSAKQLSEICSYCIVGHSERNEEYEIVITKAKNCLQSGITPIICFTQPENANKYNLKGAIIAWEDPSNISTGGIFNPKDQSDIISGLKIIREKTTEGTKVLYGGSVNLDNISDLNQIDILDGYLIGSASLSCNTFIKLIQT